jgi:hypothetical protein
MVLLLRYRFLLFAVLALSLAACGRERQQAAANEALTVEAEAVTPTLTLAPTRTPTPAPSPTPSATPTPEPLRPAVVVADQTVAANGRLTIERVVATDAGWLAVHAVSNQGAGAVLAFTALEEGEHQDITVTLDPLQVTPSLIVALYPQTAVTEADLAGSGDGIPDPGAAVAQVAFNVDVDVLWPAIIVADQEITTDGVVRLAGVTAPGPGWLLLHADAGGRPGPIVGRRLLEAGENEDLLIAIDWRQATPRLHALLHHDHGDSGRFDEAVDTPVLVQGKPVTVTFEVLLPPDIFVLDQPVVGGAVEIERVISHGPGWLAVWFDIDGRPGRVIGRAPLEDGLNEHVRVAINPAAITSFLFVTLHQDSEPLGEFNYPAADAIVEYQGETAEPVAFRIDSGNYLVARDQALAGEQSVSVPYAIVNRDAWLVIRDGTEGEPGAIIGYTWLPAGINRDVLVELDSGWHPGAGAATLYAVLHQDDGEVQQFEFPEGPDTPLTRNQRTVMAPFTIGGEND